MAEIRIPYLPSAKFIKVLCRLGIHEQDVASDTDSNPQIRTIGGTVTIVTSVTRFRYTEADGRARVVYNKSETYNIQTATGELFDANGNLGVYLLDTTSPGVDPQGWTYRATVRPEGGEPFDVVIPSGWTGEAFDLGDGLVFSPSTGITDLETRVKALEDSPSGGTSGEVEPVNVKRDHGAVGDGVADDTAAIASASAQARSEGRGLYLPRGHYRVAPAAGEAALTLTSEGPLAGLYSLHGDGPQATILEITTTAGRGLDLGVYGTHFLETVNPVTVSDLTIRGPGIGTGVGIRGRNLAKCRLINVEVDDFGSHGVDLRNANSWSFHNARIRRNGGVGVFGMYVTSRDAADPGVGLAEPNSANHGLSFSGTTLVEDNTSHGIHVRAIYALHLGGAFVTQRNGGRGAYLEEVLGLHAPMVYAEANAGDQIRLGNPAGGPNTGVRQADVKVYGNKASGGGTIVYAYACVGVDLAVYAGGFTVGTDRAVKIDTSFTGTIRGTSTSGTGKFLELANGSTLDSSGAALRRFGSTVIHSTEAADTSLLVQGVAGQTGRLLDVHDSAGTSMFYVQADGIARLSRNVVLERNVNIGVNSGAGGGVLVVPIGNATTVPTTNPANGGVLYAEGGALKWRGSGGTVTVVAPA